MRYADTGYNLEVDLSTGNIERIETDPKVTEQYIGGLGSNCKIMWDRVPPEVDAYDPENILILSAGLLVGTPAVGATRAIWTTISPQTKLIGYSMMGGYLAPEMKKAGYDKIIFSGISPNLVYLYINNDKVELRDATHLKGKTTYETADILKAEVGDSNAQVAAIGLAGENGVFYATVEHDRASASRMGIGGVMGRKGLKAIVVRGTKDIYMAKPEEFLQLCQEVIDYIPKRMATPIRGVPACIATLGAPRELREYDESWHMSFFSWGNSRHKRLDYWNPERDVYHKEHMEKHVPQGLGCYNCAVECGGLVDIPGYPKFGMKCFTRIAYNMAGYFDDLTTGYEMCYKAMEYGLDGFTCPQTLAMGIELYEDGIFTDEDLPDFPPKDEVTGNEARFWYLLDKVAAREGKVGDVLADGTHWAAVRLGVDPEIYAHNNVRKHEQTGVRTSMMNPFYLLMYSICEKSNIVQIEGQWPQMPFKKVEQREKFASDWIQLPSPKFKEYFLNWAPKTFPHEPSVEVCCEIVEWMELMHYCDDTTGVCCGLSAFNLKPPYHVHNYPKFFAAATGFDESKFFEGLARVRTLIRALNVRRGLKRTDDMVPTQHFKQRFPELEAALITGWYTLKGWDEDGIPTRERLHELDLDYVTEDFEQRGLIKKL